MRRINKEDMYATSVLMSVVSPGIASIQAQQRQGSFLTDEIKTMFVGLSARPNVPMYQCLLFTVLCGMLVAGLLAVVCCYDHKHQSATSSSPVSSAPPSSALQPPLPVLPAIVLNSAN